MRCAQFAAFLFHKSELDAREVGFCEYLYDRATVRPPKGFGLAYGTFWSVQPLGGDAQEIDFEGGAPVVGSREPPYSSGRLQSFLRAAAAHETAGKGGAPFRASFLFGAADWVDCRPFVDIAREFGGSVNVPTGGEMVRLESCGHQVMIDQPSGLVEAICRLAGGGAPTQSASGDV